MEQTKENFYDDKDLYLININTSELINLGNDDFYSKFFGCEWCFAVKFRNSIFELISSQETISTEPNNCIPFIPIKKIYKLQINGKSYTQKQLQSKELALNLGVNNQIDFLNFNHEHEK